MEVFMSIRRALSILFVAATVCAASLQSAGADATGAPATRIVRVTGSGVDLLDGAIVHSKEPTSAGMIQQSTETVELTGDLQGRVLYHVTSVFDFTQGTLTNTGHQVFSGTIVNSEPVMIHDDRFRFDVNLATGTESGVVYLSDRIAGPKVRCTLQVLGTGRNSAGNPTFDYAGECAFRGH
jgi:hypothetical protein